MHYTLRTREKIVQFCIVSFGLAVEAGSDHVDNRNECFLYNTDSPMGAVAARKGDGLVRLGEDMSVVFSSISAILRSD
jgi:hypothetical protein